MTKLHLALLSAVMTLPFAACTIDTNETSRIHASWAITRGGGEIECDEAPIPVVAVEVLSTRAGSSVGIADQFDCFDHVGTTGALAEDEFTVVVTGIDDFGDNAAAVTDSETFTVDLFPSDESIDAILPAD